jgi:hypothetical protein
MKLVQGISMKGYRVSPLLYDVYFDIFGKNTCNYLHFYLLIVELKLAEKINFL